MSRSKMLAAVRAARISFAVELAKAIEAQGMTQKEVARNAESSEPRLSRYLSGNGNPTIELMARLAFVAGHVVRITLVPIDEDKEK